MIYKVIVTETRQRTVAVEASSKNEARQRVDDAWHNCEFELDSNHFEGVEFYVAGELEGVDNILKVERKDI